MPDHGRYFTSMNESKRLKLYGAICLALAIAAIISLLNRRAPSKPAPSSYGYYYGPLRSKGDRSVYGTEDGTRVAAPGGAAKPSGEAKSESGSGSTSVD